MTRLLIFLSLIATMAAVIARLAIYNRRRRQPTQSALAEGAQPTAVKEMQPTVIEAQPTAAEKPQPIVVEETQPIQLEEAQVRPALDAPPMSIQDVQRTVVVETQREVTEETQLAGVEETWPTEEEEAQPTVLEETGPAAAEETQPQVTDEAQTTRTAEVPRGEERERREPVKRGGRPRGATQKAKEGLTQETRSYRPNPEIICWKKERQWILGVEVPEDLLSNPDLEVLQSGRPLTQDESREGCWRLEKPHDQVSVRWVEDEVPKEIYIAPGAKDYLLFKLSGPDQNQGRLVKSPSSGSYLAIVPNSWERDKALSGPPPVAPEPVSLSGYRAHFFVTTHDGDEKIAFCTPEGKPVIIKTKVSRFELVGTFLDDATESMGPLFGIRPPRIHARDDQAWQEIRTIVIGEEGSGGGKWRTQITPIPDVREQDLPSEVAARKSGWYFLRFYDTNDDLVESLDFRFISALKEIKISQPPPLPPEGEYTPVLVEFLHECGCAVQPADDLTNIRIECRDDRTILTIPPDPICYKTRWLVGPKDGPKVEVTILVERLRWAIGEEDKEPSEWVDSPLTLEREDFAATSKKVLWVLLPRRRWVDKVLVGFEQSKARTYSISITGEKVSIALRDFCDCEEAQRVGMHPLNLWFSRQQTTYMGSPCKLVVKMKCRACDFTAPSEEDMFHHIESDHLDKFCGEFFKPLTYEEMQARVPSLPSAIYKCSYCDFYATSDDPEKPNSTITKHIEKDCPKVDREGGPVRIKFRLVSDVDEIRENVISDLQRIYKCQLCGSYLDNANQRDMMRHLIQNHKNILCAIR